MNKSTTAIVALSFVFFGFQEGIAQTPSAAKEIAAEFLGATMMPRIQISGSFEFFGTDDKGELELKSSARAKGTIDTGTRKCKMAFQGYKRRVHNYSEPHETSDIEVTFDGQKWLVVKTPSNPSELPPGATYVAEVTADRPKMFLKSLDPFFFPLFGGLSEIQSGSEQIPLMQYLSQDALKGNVEVKRADGKLEVIVTSGYIRDTFYFDASKAFVMMGRKTEFDFGNNAKAPTQRIRNEISVSEVTTDSGLWFPKVAEFRQFQGDKVTVLRKFKIDEVKVLSSEDPIRAIVPPNAMVVDDRFGLTFKTKEKAAESAAPKESK